MKKTWYFALLLIVHGFLHCENESNWKHGLSKTGNGVLFVISSLGFIDSLVNLGKGVHFAKFIINKNEVRPSFYAATILPGFIGKYLSLGKVISEDGKRNFYQCGIGFNCLTNMSIMFLVAEHGWNGMRAKKDFTEKTKKHVDFN